MAEIFINAGAELQQLCRQLKQQEWITVDTEFIRERTYYAQLCLIQVATPEQLACVDPLSIDDLSPLHEILADPRILKVFHSARQDIEVFYDLDQKTPAPLFDTQVAAGLLGYDMQISYAALVEKLCGVKLKKTHTRTDWAARPLRPEQIDYAEDDVRYLREVYMKLSEALKRSGRMTWLIEDCASYTDPERYRNDPECAYLRIKKFNALSSKAQQHLRHLATWREKTAQQKNLPRSWVLRDAVLVELANLAPVRLEQLVEIKGMKDSEVKKWGDEVLRVMAETETAVSAAPPTPPLRFNREQAALRDRLLSLVKSEASRLRIHPTALATRRDIELVLSGVGDIPLLQGWRRDVIGNALLEAIAAPTLSPSTAN
jgi:ribonuclease D